MGQRAFSLSSLSLSLDHRPSTSTTFFPASNKLAVAQAELLACETHLAKKEKELQVLRTTALRDGLCIRCNALVECGMAWEEAGKDALHATESLLIESGDALESQFFPEPYVAPRTPLSPPPPPPPHKALPLHIRSETASSRGGHLSSDLSSIGPSQSASQVRNVLMDQSNTVTPSVIPNAPHPILGANGSDILHHGQHLLSVDTVTRPNSTPPLAPPIRSSSPFAFNTHRSNSMTHSPRPVTYDTTEIKVPPAHSICDGMVPVVAGTVPSTPEPRHFDSGYNTPVSCDGDSNLALEASTGYPVTQTSEDSKVENDVTSPDLLVHQEEKLLVIENPRFHQVPPAVSEPSGAEPLMTEGTVEVLGPAFVPITASAADGPPRQGVSVVREIEQDLEPPNGPPPGVHLSIPAGEPRTPKKSAKNTASPSPQKSGFLDSLKKVFNGGGHRESSTTPQEKTREKKELREREKKRDKAREREVRREEHQREKQEKAKEKKNQKLAKERDREMRLLAPSSSSEDDDSLRRYRKEEEAHTSKFAGKKKNKTEKDGAELRNDSDSWTADGFLMRKNTELEKNLKGGILRAKRGEHAHEPGSRRSSVAAMAMEDRRWGGDGSVQRSAFIVERGAKYTQSLNVSPFLQRTQHVSSSSVSQAPPSRRLNDTRFREELNSQNPMNGAPAVIFPAVGDTVGRKSSKKQSSAVGAKHVSVLGKATAPAGMSTGLGDRKGFVGTSVLTPRASMVGGAHGRAVSVDHGQSGRVPRGDLMSIVDDVTRSNRRAWDGGFGDDAQRRRLLPEPVSSGLGGRDEDKGRVQSDEDDSASSSYETGREDFDDDDERLARRRMMNVASSLKRKSVRVSLNPTYLGVEADVKSAWDDDSDDGVYEEAKLSLLKATALLV